MYLLPGVIGFVFFILFDLNKIYRKSKLRNLFFVIGAVLLIFSTGYSIRLSGIPAGVSRFGIGQVLQLLCLISSGAMLIYVLFFALPFEKTYVQSEYLPLVNKGFYGACRHPGFWMFALFYMFLAWIFSSDPLLYCFILYTICNFVYIVIQDRYIFPKYIQGYTEYKKEVPFLIPTRNSIRNALKK